MARLVCCRQKKKNNNNNKNKIYLSKGKYPRLKFIKAHNTPFLSFHHRLYEIKHILECAREIIIWFLAAHIPGSSNGGADQLS